MDMIKERFKEKADKLSADVKDILKEHGQKVIGQVQLSQIYQGMRGMTGLVTETSLLDSQEGIRFRGYSIPELREKLPKAPIRLSRKNLMARDGYQCQYCAKKPALRTDLDIDHVLPKCRGGESSWENLVTSCKPCNVRKGRWTPSEAGMQLLRKPTRPRWSLALQILLSDRAGFKEWEPFLKAA